MAPWRPQCSWSLNVFLKPVWPPSCLHSSNVRYCACGHICDRRLPPGPDGSSVHVVAWQPKSSHSTSPGVQLYSTGFFKELPQKHGFILNQCRSAHNSPLHFPQRLNLAFTTIVSSLYKLYSQKKKSFAELRELKVMAQNELIYSHWDVSGSFSGAIN